MLNCSRGLHCIFSNFSPVKSFYNNRPILLKWEIRTYLPPPPPTFCNLLKMAKALLLSSRTAVLLTFFFNLVCFLVFLSRTLRRWGSLANIFSTLTKNGRRLAELLFFSVLIADSTSTTSYILTTNQCLIFFTNLIRILFLNLRLLKLAKNTHWQCQTFSFKTWWKNIILLIKSTPLLYKLTPPTILQKKYILPYKVSFENLHLPILSGGANYGFIYRNKFRKKPTPCLFHPLLQLSTKE